MKECFGKSPRCTKAAAFLAAIVIITACGIAFYCAVPQREPAHTKIRVVYAIQDVFAGERVANASLEERVIDKVGKLPEHLIHRRIDAVGKLAKHGVSCGQIISENDLVMQ